MRTRISIPGLAASSRPLSRRTALRAFGGAGAALALAAHGGGGTVGAAQTAVEPVEPTAGTWRPWLLNSGDQFRPAAPPDDPATGAELDRLEELAAARDETDLERIAYWSAGAPAYRWNELTIQHLLANGIGGPPAVRVLAHVNAAIADATIAAWDAKFAYNRPRPAAARPTLGTVGPTPASPAYPSEHAVTAGAAVAVLGFLFPDAAERFSALADEAGTSRLLAGTDYPSDVTTGMELGRQVAALAIERAASDGSDAPWTGSVPTEPGKWNGETPAIPAAATWKTWVLTSPDQFRPEPPPAPDSDQLLAELDEVKQYERTTLSDLTAAYWEYYGGRASFALYTEKLGQKLFEAKLDDNPPRAARAYALMHIAFSDIFISCWDAKYAYWAIRPDQLDPTVTTVFPTPNHPSYPAAHACVGGAMETVLGSLFPSDADAFTAMADEESWSRLWAGIHFRSDIEAGRTLGHQVGQMVVDRARQDGAD